MKTCTQEEREAELEKAKNSNRDWVHFNRTWDFNAILDVVRHEPSRMAVVKDLLRRGFFIKNMDAPVMEGEDSRCVASQTEETPSTEGTYDSDSVTGQR